MTEITIAEATRDHLGSIVRLHMDALPTDENIVTALGPGAVRSAYRWFLDDGGAVVLAAFREGQLIGFTSMVDRPYSSRLLLRVLPRAVAALLCHPSLLAKPVLRKRMARLFRRNGQPLPEGAHVAYTAVAAEERGRGVGAALKDASIRWCRDRGIERMITGIHEDNLASRRMNEKAGFTEAPEYRSDDMLIFVLPIERSVASSDSDGDEGER